jgi:hypothetical protein
VLSFHLHGMPEACHLQALVGSLLVEKGGGHPVQEPCIMGQLPFLLAEARRCLPRVQRGGGRCGTLIRMQEGLLEGLWLLRRLRLRLVLGLWVCRRHSCSSRSLWAPSWWDGRGSGGLITHGHSSQVVSLYVLSGPRVPRIIVRVVGCRLSAGLAPDSRLLSGGEEERVKHSQGCPRTHGMPGRVARRGCSMIPARG